MKQIILFAILIAATNSAFAETSSTTKPPKAKNRTRTEVVTPTTSTSSNPSTTISNTSTATSSFNQAIHASYTAIMSGPILDAERNRTSNISVSNRIAARADLSEMIDTGFQVRLNTAFIQNKIVASNENWRLFANIKKIYNDGFLDFNLTPRIMLPTSNSAHNQTLIAGPELIATLNFNPSNSRFTFDYKAQTQKNLYSDKLASNQSMSFYLLHNFEANYTLGSTTEINFGIYPEYTSTRSAAFTNTSNEVDLGLTWSFAKGWSLNPYLATELVGLDTANPGKKMQANLTLSGALL
jgi:hypothetical protein